MASTLNSFLTQGLSKLFGQRDRFSVEELSRLNNILIKNAEVNEGNKELVVETLRLIAELIIWGDQHDQSIIDSFFEGQMLAHFHKILNQRNNRNVNDLVKQVLQTLSIMIQNIKSETSVFYLFSNNHINNIIRIPFDFEDDEVLGYFVNLLKTISLKMTDSTFHFFFQHGYQTGSGQFPLYTEATKFFRHKESMVRAAVRTLTLNVYRTRNTSLVDFILGQGAGGYFSDLADYLVERCQNLDRVLSAAEASTSDAEANKVDMAFAEVEDLVCYCADILGQASYPIQRHLCHVLWKTFVGPVVFWPLLSAATAATGGAGGQSARTALRPARAKRPAVRALVALVVLERLLILLQHPPLVNGVAASLLLGDHAVTTLLLRRYDCEELQPPPLQRRIGNADDSVTSPVGPGPRHSSRDNLTDDRFPIWTSGGAHSPSQTVLNSPGSPVRMGPLSIVAPSGGAGEHPEPRSPKTPGSESAGNGAGGGFNSPYGDGGRPYYAALMGILRGRDLQLATAATRVMCAVMLNKVIDADLLDTARLLPQRMKKTRDIIEMLVNPAGVPREVPWQHTAADVGMATPGPEERTPYWALGARGDSAGYNRGGTPTYGESPRWTPNLERRSWSALERRSGNPLERRSGKPPAAPGGSQYGSQPLGEHPFSRESTGFMTPTRTSPTPRRSLERTSISSAIAPLTRTHATDVDALVGAVVLMQLEGTSLPPPLEHFRMAGTHLPDDLARLMLDDRCPLQLIWLAAWLVRQLLPAERGGRGPSVMAVEQREQLEPVFRAAIDSLSAECEGTWGEAVPQLIRAAWSATRAGISVPTLSATSEHYLLDRGSFGTAGAAGAAGGDAASAAAAADPSRVSLQVAVQCSGHVFRAVAVLQLRALLRHGRVPPDPPVPSDSCHLQSGPLEGMEVSMEGREHLVCKVSFQKGVEQTVYFFIRPSWERWDPRSGTEPPPATRSIDSVPGANNISRMSPLGRESWTPGPHNSTHGDLGSAGRSPRLSSPQLVLGIPVEDTMAKVLATAPLYGARPETDKRHGRWLHVHVRPPLADLVRSVGGVPPLAAQSMLRRTSMRDGHWVLAFPDADRSAAAKDLVERALQQEQNIVRGVIGQLCGDDLIPDGVPTPSKASRHSFPGGGGVGPLGGVGSPEPTGLAAPAPSPASSMRSLAVAPQGQPPATMDLPGATPTQGGAAGTAAAPAAAQAAPAAGAAGAGDSSAHAAGTGRRSREPEGHGHPHPGPGINPHIHAGTAAAAVLATATSPHSAPSPPPQQSSSPSAAARRPLSPEAGTPPERAPGSAGSGPSRASPAASSGTHGTSPGSKPVAHLNVPALRLNLATATDDGSGAGTLLGPLVHMGQQAHAGQQGAAELEGQGQRGAGHRF